MTKSDLLKLSKKKLAQIAAEYSLNLNDYNSNEECIEDILEIAREEFKEISDFNNTVSQIRNKKFILNQDVTIGFASGEIQCSEDAAIFVNTFFKVILRDNHWAFVLWQISNMDAINYHLEEDDYELVIRVFGCEKEGENLKVVDEFETPVKRTDVNRYINLPVQDRYYYMELYCVRESSRVMLARTNTVFAPMLRINNINDFVNVDALLISNRIYQSVILPDKEGESASQKIIHDSVDNEGEDL